ncbi:hypothetical protein AG1IA_02601 [Rhizoctonia solani AG-1 IA]|uniref:Uncharacterized protein n=1 Tax=Thanatephorus cucumeris (strain AG1-IA) TaxID=983506 RepID=L8X2P8_THACA|nr:hypothetical protein AG1IA_02601 [Rhizoctonia solani AG-1 IA]
MTATTEPSPRVIVVDTFINRFGVDICRIPLALIHLRSHGPGMRGGESVMKGYLDTFISASGIIYCWPTSVRTSRDRAQPLAATVTAAQSYQ